MSGTTGDQPAANSCQSVPRKRRPRNLVLIGFSFTGKSTIARLLARRLRWKAVDTDREILRRTGRTPQEIFAKKGEAVFRRLEQQVIRELCEEVCQVIATGGGAPMDPMSRALLFADNVVVLLDASPEAILRRLQGSRSGERRPLLDSSDPLERVRTLKAERDPVYRQAHLVIETERLTPEESAKLIHRLVGLRG